MCSSKVQNQQIEAEGGPTSPWGIRERSGVAPRKKLGSSEAEGSERPNCPQLQFAHHPELLSLAERGSGVRAWTTGRGRPEEFRQAKIRAIETWGSKLRLQLRPVGIRIVARPVGKVAIQISSE